jgi:hypothetical protein
MLLNRQQRFDLYAHSARRAPLGRSGWPDGYRMIALIWPLLLSTTTSAAASRPHDPVSQKKAPLGRGSGSGDQRFTYSSSVSAQCGPSRTHKGRPAAKPSGPVGCTTGVSDSAMSYKLNSGIAVIGWGTINARPDGSGLCPARRVC